MTIPFEPQPPATIGTQPQTASEVNALTGTHLRDFLRMQRVISQDADFFAAADLKAAPYYFTDAQETDLKSAIVALDQELDAVDLTFINRVVGMG